VKGIILAGGTGTRLYPLTRLLNKHVLPVGRKPMIYYPIEKMIGAGVRDILIVTGTEHMGSVVGLLGSGREFDCEFTYRVQDQAGGIAEALYLGKEFARGERILVILGDNLFKDDLGLFVERFARQGRGARVLLKEVEDPERFGVPELKGDRIVSIEEKPKEPKSNYAVTGVYMYDDRVFEIIRTLERSQRGELEITDVNNAYIKRNELAFDVLQGWWSDAGTFESLARANQLVGDGK
jgi:glucose-1-phosphate thymidylyltransferase